MKTLLLDIETKPAVVYAWGLFNETMSVEQIVEPGGILCFTAKWLHEKQARFYATWRGGEESMLQAAHGLLDEADALVTYYGSKFDLPWLNGEFMRRGWAPPSPYASIDLKRELEHSSHFISKKLAFVGPHLGVGEKIKHRGFDLWRGVMAGDKTCQAEMEKYCRQDTLLLEPLYKRLLPWLKFHPNMGLFVDVADPVCPRCGSRDVQRRGVHRAVSRVYPRYHCQKCGRWSRGVGADKTVKPALV